MKCLGVVVQNHITKGPGCSLTPAPVRSHCSDSKLGPRSGRDPPASSTEIIKLNEWNTVLDTEIGGGGTPT